MHLHPMLTHLLGLSRLPRSLTIISLSIVVSGLVACQPMRSLTTTSTSATNSTPNVQSFIPQKIQIRSADLPKPFATESASRSPQVVDRPANFTFNAPPGFKVQSFAVGLSRPRWLTVAANGDVFLAESYDNRIRLLRDTNGDGTADINTVFLDNLSQPLGMAISPDQKFFYVANTDAVVRFPYQMSQTKIQAKPQQITKLTGGGYRQHWTRNLIFSPDGKKLYVSVGSKSNADPEDLPRASIQVMNLDGSDRQTYASGLRNPVGLAFHPKTRVLYTTVNERDGLGDDLVPDYLTGVKAGGFYGWPFTYLGKNRDPRLPQRPDLAAKTIIPDVLFQAHSAALGLTFYTGNQFPAQYQNDAFVAFRGSWNRAKGTGYKIVRVPFNPEGQPKGYYEDFLTGWLLEPKTPTVWGRPVGLTIAKDGALLITDESSGTIWRVTHSQ